MTPKPTLSDVASLAGVSIKTVSRVVNEEPNVTAKTAKRVLDAVQVLGYRPNPLARSLRTGRDEAVALVVERIGDPFFASMTEAVEEAAREAGLFLIIASVGESAAQERAVISGLLHRSVCGLIARPSHLDFAAERLPIGAGGVPVVFVDRPSGSAEADSVLIDNTGTARRATAHLISHGHRRIAFVGTALDRLPLQWRLEGYRAALADAGIAYDGDLVVSHHRPARDHPPFLTKVLGLRDPATAVLSANAVASLDVVSELHGDARTDVAFVGFDDFPMAAFLTPAVTVARQDPALMGRTAMELLLERIRGESSPPKHVVVPTTFVIRGSGEIPPPTRAAHPKGREVTGRARSAPRGDGPRLGDVT
ncbi:MAG TPA: LacI family DNA-binding transcriptional regulator [Acidimicrobiales bacterium]|nr:LacI family DNA-binding transcriptional regulator [Acidimicrobiales bacterium]